MKYIINENNNPGYNLALEEYVFKNTGKREFYPPKFEYKISDYGNIIKENSQ